MQNSQKPKFEIRDEIASADFIFDAYGDSLNELFASCAAACFSAMTDLEKVAPTREFSMELRGDDIEELLYGFISEIIYLKDLEKVFFSVFDVDIGSDRKSLKAVVAGETIDYNKHTIKTDVKAATYHDLQITKLDGGFRAHMVLDL
jgi:SHS2 domain-containing protein